jgi:hypothetical protein
MPRRVARRLGRRGALLALMLLYAPPLLADPACDFARITLLLDASSRQIVLESQGAASELAIKDLERRLRGMAGYTSKIAESGGDQRTFALIAEVIQSRLGLLAVLRTRGLEAAQAYMLSRSYIERADRVQEVLASRPDCDPQVAQGTRPSDVSTHLRQPIAERAHHTRPGQIGPAPKVQPPAIVNSVLALIALALAILAGLKLLAYRDQRGDRRYMCNILTQLQIGDVEHTVRVTDISRTGAKLQGRNRLGPGDRAELLLGVDLHKVRVAWANPNFVGVIFRRRLDFSPRTLIGGARRSW